MELSVNRTDNTYLHRLAVEACFHDIVEDGTPTDIITTAVDVVRDCWLEIRLNDIFIGSVQFKHYNNSVVEVHAYILPNARRYSQAALGEVAKYFDEFAPDNYNSMFTKVPTCKRYAKIAVMRQGFKQVGVLADAFVKDNKYYDIVFFQRVRMPWVI